MIRIPGPEPKTLALIPSGARRAGGNAGPSNGGAVSALGYPPAVEGHDGRAQWYVQEAAEGLKYCACVETRRVDGQTLAAVALTSTRDGADVLALARQRCAAALGRLLDNTEPQILIDSRNRLHILQGIAAKTYVYSAIDPNGGIAARRMYLSDRSRPAMQRDTVGEVTVVGGILQDPTKAGGLDGTMSAPGNGVPKLSDRPVALPQE